MHWQKNNSFKKYLLPGVVIHAWKAKAEGTQVWAQAGKLSDTCLNQEKKNFFNKKILKTEDTVQFAGPRFIPLYPPPHTS